MKQEEISYPWHKAPNWAQWAAVDEDGRAYWYAEKPNLRPPIWGTPHQEVLPIESNKLKKIKNWKESLQKRPDGSLN